jgi:hypothetical protein
MLISLESSQRVVQDPHIMVMCVATSLWRKCEVATHIPENGTWESSGTPKNSERNCRGQNTLHWSNLYTIGKVLKCRCPKWPHMSHLDIWSTSYGRKKGRESNWQFDSRPLKVGNRPDSGACRWSVTHYWKAFEESYNFGSDLVTIRARGEKLWSFKISRVQTGIVSRLHFGSPGKKSHLNASAAESCREYIRGKVVASLESGPWWVKWIQGCSWLVLTPKGCKMSSNQLVVGFGCRIT